MTRLFNCLILLVLWQPIHAQVVEPPEQPPAKKPVKFKAVAPLTVKAGDHIVVDASSAAGEVWFFYDEVIFPKVRATVTGKVLVLSTNVNGKHVVDVASLDDKSKERIVVTVTGGIDPIPDKPPVEPPPVVDPPSDLKVIMALLAKLDARVSALEKQKPIPPPATGLLTDVTFVFSPQDPAAVAVNNSGELRNMLKAAKVKVWVIYESGLASQSQKFQQVVADGGGLPIAIMQDDDGNVIDVARMTTVAKMIEATTKHIKR